MTPVTDPVILQQLGGGKPVTDPAILAQLEGDEQAQMQEQPQVAPQGKITPEEYNQALSKIRGLDEAAASVGSSLVAEPVAGVAGLVSAPFVGAEQAQDIIEATRGGMTYQPRTEVGKERLGAFAETLEPVASALKATEQYLGDVGYEKAGPYGGAAMSTLPAAALSAFGLGGTRKATQVGKSLKTPIEEAAGKQLTSALEKGMVLTSDIRPPTTFVGKAMQKISERVPILGTGKKRAAQQKSRVEAIDNLAREFDLDPSTAFDQRIVSSANKVFKQSQDKAAKFRLEAVNELNKMGEITPRNALKTIDDEMAKIVSLGERGDKALLETLSNIKNELSGNFERMKDIRTTIFNDISDITNVRSKIKSGGDASLSKVAGSLSKDLDGFATQASKQALTPEMAKAANKWKASNRIFKDNFSKAKDTELKNIMTKGKLKPEIINSVIRGGKSSELNRLHANLDMAGRKATQQQILKNAIEKSKDNPTILLNELNRLNNKKAIDVFFSGKDKAYIDGFKKFLNLTRRAQTESASIASQAEVSAAALIGGAAVAPKPVIAAAATIGLTARAFESPMVRNLLIKLNKATPKQQQNIMGHLKSLMVTSGIREK